MDLGTFLSSISQGVKDIYHQKFRMETERMQLQRAELEAQKGKTGVGVMMPIIIIGGIMAVGFLLLRR